MKTCLLGTEAGVIWSDRIEHEFSPMKDIKMEVLLDAMSKGDSFKYTCIRKVFEHHNSDISIIYYRQDVLKDFLANPKLVSDITKIAENVYNQQFSFRNYELIVDNPTSVISISRKRIMEYVLSMQKLRKIMETYRQNVKSEALKGLGDELKKNISDSYVKELFSLLQCVENLDEIEMNATLTTGYKMINYKLCHPQGKREKIQKVRIEKNDFASSALLLELKQSTLEETANLLADAAEQIYRYFENLRKEMAFYQGCVQLYEELTRLGISVCFPIAHPVSEHRMKFKELGDVALALSKKEKVVTNSFDLTNHNPVIVTGANQGGKSTFIRSVALAQLMMQCGMFVGSSYFESSVCRNVFTHFRKNEDKKLNSGKLDEELKRLSDMIEYICGGDMIFFNESFSSTNEKEGTDLAIPITNALLSQGIRIFYVTHFYTYTHYYHQEQGESCMLLKAQRNTDTSRSFRLEEGVPDVTSYASDIYNRIFG